MQNIIPTAGTTSISVAFIAALTLTTGCGSSGSNKGQASSEAVASSSAATLSSSGNSSSVAAVSSQITASSESILSSEEASSSSVANMQTTTVTDLNTGSRQAPKTVYFDFDSGGVLDITEAQAGKNTQWDMAFNRTKVYLNQLSDADVSLYYTGSADDFYDAENKPIKETFLDPDIDTIYANFDALSGSAVPTDAVFTSDAIKSAIDDFYLYNFMTHEVTANPAAFFVVASGDAYGKFNVTGLTQSGFGMTDMTLSLAYQVSGSEVFDEPKSLWVSAENCAGDLYVDIDTQSLVTVDDPWELRIPCAEGLASIEMHLADTVTAISGDSANIDGVEAASASYYTWLADETIVSAYKENGPTGSGYGWGEYGLDGGHFLWPNYATNIIKTKTGAYKFQITNYYSTDGNYSSGNYSFRFAPITLTQ